MDTTIISIIVPVYNVKDYLADCVNSLVNQHFEDYEILLIDDGSTDGSSEICDAYAANYDKVCTYHKKNGGLSSARNMGIEKAKGKWIIFVDSDDYWVSESVLSILISAVEKRRADLVRFEYTAVDEDGEYLYEYEYKKEHLVEKELTPYELFHGAVAGEFFAWLYLIKRDLIADIRFDESRKFQEDIDFFLRLFATRNFIGVYCDKRLYAYRKRRNSITSTPNIYNLEGSFTLSDVFYEYSHGISDVKLKKEYQHYAVMMYYWTLFTIAEPSFYKIRREVYKQVDIFKLYFTAIKRMICCGIISKATLLIMLPPQIGVSLIYIKTILFAKYSSGKKDQ